MPAPERNADPEGGRLPGDGTELPARIIATLGTGLVLGVALRAVVPGVTAILRGVLPLLARDATGRLVTEALWAPLLSRRLGEALGVGLAWGLAAGLRAGAAGCVVTVLAWAAVAAWLGLGGVPVSPAGRILAGVGGGLLVAGGGSLVAGGLAGAARARGGGVGIGRAWRFQDPFAAGFAGMLAAAALRSPFAPDRLASDLALAVLAGLAGAFGARLGGAPAQEGASGG